MLKPKRQKNTKSKVLSNFTKSNCNFKNTSISVNLDNVCLESFNKIYQLSHIPNKGEHIRIVTRKMINAFDFLLAIINQESIEELTIAVYRIGKKTANQLHELQKKGSIGKITILLNDGFPKLVPDCYNFIKSLESNNWSIKIENNHTKIMLAKTKDNYYCIEGSGNLSINARIEQYCFDNNQEIYNFHYNWIKDI